MRRLCLFAVPFSAAVFGAVYLLPGQALAALGAVCVLAGGLFTLLRRRRRTDGFLRAALICLGLGAGLLWTRGYDQLALAPARALDGAELSLSATVADWPEESAWGGTAVTVRLHTPGGRKVRTRLRLDAALPELRPGDKLAFTGRFALADTIAGEATDYYFSRGVLLTAYAREAAVAPVGGFPPRYWPQAVSKAIKDSVAAHFPADTAGFLIALLTGDKGKLDGGLYTALQRSGVAHVVAVSGLHVSFFAGLLTALLGKRRRLGMAVVIGLLIFFAAVAGNAPSVLRAVFMQSMLLLAPLLGREDDRPTSLAAILMLLLLQNPYAAASISLQLSFAAVAGIYLFTVRLYACWTGGLRARGQPWYIRALHAAWRFIAASLAVTLGALAFTTPLTAYYFGMISLAAPVTNLLTLWAVSDAFLGGLLSALAGLVLPGLGSALGALVAWPVRWVRWVAEGVSALPFAAVSTAVPYVAIWLGFSYLLLVLYLAWRGKKKRPQIPAGASLILLCAALLLQAGEAGRDGLAVSVLDVGQGQSVLLSSGGACALVDCGGTGARDPGDVAADYVQRTGRTVLDLLVLTHYHADHAGGVPELFARLKVGAVALPDVTPEDPLRARVLELAAEEGAEVFFITEDSALSLGQARLTLYAPLGAGGGNEEGLSALCSLGDFDVLVTGDMNAAVERRLVKYGALPRVEVLVAGHHGSAGSSSEELLRAAAPETAIISVGYNSYGQPAPEALERLAAAGCDIYRTDLQGTVTVQYKEADPWHLSPRRTTPRTKS